VLAKQRGKGAPRKKRTAEGMVFICCFGLRWEAVWKEIANDVVYRIEKIKRKEETHSSCDCECSIRYLLLGTGLRRHISEFKHSDGAMGMWNMGVYWRQWRNN